MAIFVNVSRSTTSNSTPEELQAFTVGVWPVRSPAEYARVVAEIGDAIYGVRGNEIVSAYQIKAITVGDNGRFTVTSDTAGQSAIQTRIGRALPDGFKWKSGEAWPVKFIDIAAFDEAFTE